MQNDDEISKIEDIKSYVDSLSIEEIRAKIALFSNILKEKTEELVNVNSVLAQKDAVNFKENSMFSVNDLKSGGESSPREADENLIRKDHQRNLISLDKQNQENIKKETEKIDEEFTKEIDNISSIHDKKVEDFRKEISNLHLELEDYKNKDKYITKKEHEKKIYSIISSKEKSIENCEETIEKIENNIRKNFSSLINNNSKIRKKFPPIDISTLGTEEFEKNLNDYFDAVKAQKEVNKENKSIVLLNPSVRESTFKESIIVNKTEGSDFDEGDCECNYGENDDCIINKFPTSNYQVFKK